MTRLPCAMASGKSTTGQPHGRRGDLAALVLFVVVLAGIILVGGHSAQRCGESFYRTMVARDLLGGLSRGREALVGSLSMAPVPTVAVTLLSLIPYVTRHVSAGTLAAAVSALLLCMYANRAWAGAGFSASLRYPAIACMLLLPPVALSIQSGRSTMLFVAPVVCACGLLGRWLRHRRLRDLAYSALLLGASVGVRHQAALIVALACAVVVAATLLRRRSPALLEARAILFLTPSLYLAALWMGGNWLILGNPLFFLRGVARSIRLGTLGAQSLLWSGCEWTLLGGVGLLVLSAPLAAVLYRRAGPHRHAAALGGAVAGALLVLLGGAAAPRAPDPRIPRTVAMLERHYPNASFIVTGYEGYAFARAAGDDPEHCWIHLMRLAPERLREVLSDYEGREIYVLLTAEPGLERWEALGLEWRGAGDRLPEGFLYRDRVGPWVLFECLRRGEALLVEGS